MTATDPIQDLQEFSRRILSKGNGWIRVSPLGQSEPMVRLKAEMQELANDEFAGCAQGN